MQAAVELKSTPRSIIVENLAKLLDYFAGDPSPILELIGSQGEKRGESLAPRFMPRLAVGGCVMMIKSSWMRASFALFDYEPIRSTEYLISKFCQSRGLAETQVRARLVELEVGLKLFELPDVRLPLSLRRWIQSNVELNESNIARLDTDFIWRMSG